MIYLKRINQLLLRERWNLRWNFVLRRPTTIYYNFIIPPLWCKICCNSSWWILSLYSSTTQGMGRSYTIGECSDRSRPRCTNIYNWVRSKWTSCRNDISRIYGFLKYMTISKASMIYSWKVHKRKRYKLRRVMLRIHKKIRCLINDCHYKLANGCAKTIVLFCCPSLRHREWKRRIRWLHGWC